MQIEMAAPERTLEQRMEALVRANDIRSRRARFKAQVKRSRNGGGRKQALELLAEVPDWAKSMKALDLLMAIPKVGLVKANRLLRVAQCSPSKTVGGLSPRQRTELHSQIASLV